MGKIVMPKNSALLNEIESVLEIYYEADDWLSNDVYKDKLKTMIGDDQYSSSYTKKAQITSYFGFTEWENINNPQSLRRITDTGKEMYRAIKTGDENKVHFVLMHALETVKFGRNNYGCPDSNSDVEPPSLFIRASLDLGYLTYKEFAFLLWKLEDVGGNYTDALAELRNYRSKGNLVLSEDAVKYADCKPIIILLRWGFLVEDEDDKTGGKHITVNPTVINKYHLRLKNLKVYNIDMDCNMPIIDKDRTVVDFDKAKRISNGTNIILYGVPGSGKSWTINHEYCKKDSIVNRLVFHPDYTNADFVGQILPIVDEEKQVTYEFTPGPFTTILKSAYQNPLKHFILIIEEINRGNSPAIFGEVFQLLDRKVEMNEAGDYPIGTSEYEITHKYIAEYVYNDPEHKVRIPSNLTIIGTMNTSDQNVFTLDTAFQRRWKMRLIENNFDNVHSSLANAQILDTSVTWKRFCETINTIIVGNKAKMASSEDKRLGVYFIHAGDIKFDNRAIPNDGFETLLDEQIFLIELERLSQITEYQKQRLIDVREAVMNIRMFPEKVVKYLWDDAFKFNHEALFEKDMDNLEKVIRTFVYSTGLDRFKIFKQSVRDILCK